MITGDGNLVELQATVRYTRRRPAAVTCSRCSDAGRGDPRRGRGGAARGWSPAQPFLDLLTVDRGRVQERGAGPAGAAAAEVGPDGLGVRLDGLSLHDLHPPQEVVVVPRGRPGDPGARQSPTLFGKISQKRANSSSPRARSSSEEEDEL